MSTGQGVLKPVIRGLYGNRVVTFNNNIKVENNQWGDDHGLEVNPFGTQSIEVIKGQCQCFMVVMLLVVLFTFHQIVSLMVALKLNLEAYIIQIIAV